MPMNTSDSVESLHPDIALIPWLRNCLAQTELLVHALMRPGTQSPLHALEQERIYDHVLWWLRSRLSLAEAPVSSSDMFPEEVRFLRVFPLELRGVGWPNPFPDPTEADPVSESVARAASGSGLAQDLAQFWSRPIAERSATEMLQMHARIQEVLHEAPTWGYLLKDGFEHYSIAVSQLQQAGGSIFLALFAHSRDALLGQEGVKPAALHLALPELLERHEGDAQALAPVFCQGAVPIAGIWVPMPLLLLEVLERELRLAQTDPEPRWISVWREAVSEQALLQLQAPLGRLSARSALMLDELRTGVATSPGTQLQLRLLEGERSAYWRHGANEFNREEFCELYPFLAWRLREVASPASVTRLFFAMLPATESELEHARAKESRLSHLLQALLELNPRALGWVQQALQNLPATGASSPRTLEIGMLHTQRELQEAQLQVQERHHIQRVLLNAVSCRPESDTPVSESGRPRRAPRI